MAKLKGTKLKIDTGPIKSIKNISEAWDPPKSTTIITQNSTTYTFEFKGKGGTHKIINKGKFNFSTQSKFIQSSFYSYKYYINNKINETLTGVNFKAGEVIQAVSSVKNFNNFTIKSFNKNDTNGGKANDKLWGYLEMIKFLAVLEMIFYGGLETINNWW